jgi:glycosyltransferase involved in cell wall biosynthesis
MLRTLEMLGNWIEVPKHMVKLVNDCEACMSFGEYDSGWLRNRGAKRVITVRPPIMNATQKDFAVRLIARLPHGKPKIVVGLSDLRSLATREALRFFAKEILPRLELELGADGFEAHVIGEGDLPAELAKLLPRPSVVLRGRVEPVVDDELLSADIVLIPTPIIFALRNRIIYAFSLGCCVVAHSNEAKNLPEMVHEENALLAPNGEGLAQAVVRALRDPELRNRLGLNARHTYARYFTPGVAAAPIVFELERLAKLGKE